MSHKMTASNKRTTRSRTAALSTKVIASPAPKCYLMTIPPEVRDSILRYLLRLPEFDEKPSESNDVPRSQSILSFTHNYHGTVNIIGSGRPGSWISIQGESDRAFRHRVRTLKALTHTCKALYFESVALFYAHHSYTFDCANSCAKMLRIIGPGRRQHIKDVTLTLEDISSDNKQPGNAAKLLVQCNLKRLKIIVNRNTVRTMFTRNLFRAAGVKKLREIRGCEEVAVQQVSYTWLTPGTLRYYYQPQELLYPEEHVKEFHAVLKAELCQAREQVREVVKEIVVEEHDE